MNILNHTAHAKINTMKSRRTGFTIVELLVVIVVIAILATNVVVA
jgi:prepilin-type N-terminal cleavage/methylation domain-containing protein